MNKIIKNSLLFMSAITIGMTATLSWGCQSSGTFTNNLDYTATVKWDSSMSSNGTITFGNGQSSITLPAKGSTTINYHTDHERLEGTLSVPYVSGFVSDAPPSWKTTYSSSSSCVQLSGPNPANPTYNLSPAGPTQVTIKYTGTPPSFSIGPYGSSAPKN